MFQYKLIDEIPKNHLIKKRWFFGKKTRKNNQEHNKNIEGEKFNSWLL